MKKKILIENKRSRSTCVSFPPFRLFQICKRTRTQEQEQPTNVNKEKTNTV